MALTLASDKITFTDNTSLSSGIIGTAQLSAGAVTAEKIASGAVTTASIAASAVTANKINLTTSLSSNGYQIMPNGLIMQWGNTGSSGYFNSPGKLLTVNFPIPFPTACLNIQGTARVYSTGTAVAVPEINDLTNTYVVWQDGDNDSTPWDIYWFAIGY